MAVAAKSLLVFGFALACVGALRASHLDAAAASSRVCGGLGAGRDEGQRAASYYWSNKNGDAGSTGFSEHIAPSNISGGPIWSWKDLVEDLVLTHPCIDSEKNIYLASRNGAVRKFRLSGETVWQNEEFFVGPFATVLVGNSALMDGAIHVGLVDGSVASIDMETGRTRWRVKASVGAGPDTWSLMARDGIVITAGRSEGWKSQKPDTGGSDLLIALDARDGKTLWMYRPQGVLYRFMGSFAEGPPSLVFANAFGVPHRVSLCDGRLLWSNPEGREHATVSPGGAVVEATGDRVFVVGNDAVEGTHASVAAYDARTGHRLWSHRSDLPAGAAPALGSLQGPGGRLSVVVAAGESPGLPDPAAEKSGRFSDGRAVAFASRVYALDAATGEPTGWEFRPPTYRSPAASGDKFPVHLCLPQAWSGATVGGDGTVYLGHMNGKLYALRDADGDGKLSVDGGEVTEFDGSRCYQGSPGVAPGLLVATPCDGMYVFTA